MFEGPPDLLKGPALQAPPGVTAHFTRYSPFRTWFYTCVPLCTIFPGLFVILCLYTKLKIVRKLEVSDYFIVAGFISFIVEICVGIPTLSHGAGNHQWNLRMIDFMHIVFWVNVSEIIYCLSIFLVKSSIVLQYIQILAPLRSGNRVMYYGGWTVIVAMFIFYGVGIFVTIFGCIPREKIWNPFRAGGKCIDPHLHHQLVIASAIFNLTTDLIILLLPVQAVWRLRINQRKKVAIILLFSTGICATAACAMRMPSMFKLQKQGANQDRPYEWAWMALWTWAELALGIMIACTLSFPKLVRAKSKEISSLLETISRPFTSLKSLSCSTIRRSTSHARGLVKIKSHETRTQQRPRVRDVVHAPPGLTLNSDTRSFVRHDSLPV